MQIRTSAELGALARDRRREIGWSQLELAERIGTSRSWVSEMENGKERVEIALVLKALHALGLMLDVRSRGTETGSRTAAPPPLRVSVAREHVSARPPLTRGGKSLSAARSRVGGGGTSGS